MENKLSDLIDSLFGKMERLSDEDLSEMEEELARSETLCKELKQIIRNRSLELNAAKKG